MSSKEIFAETWFHTNHSHNVTRITMRNSYDSTNIHMLFGYRCQQQQNI